MIIQVVCCRLRIGWVDIRTIYGVAKDGYFSPAPGHSSLHGNGLAGTAITAERAVRSPDLACTCPVGDPTGAESR